MKTALLFGPIIGLIAVACNSSFAPPDLSHECPFFALRSYPGYDTLEDFVHSSDAIALVRSISHSPDPYLSPRIHSQNQLQVLEIITGAL